LKGKKFISSSKKEYIGLIKINFDNGQSEYLKIFTNSNSDELPQYSSLYLKRLEMTKKKLLEDSKKKWPKVHICKNILDLKGNVIILFIINIFYFRKSKLSLD
jgi:hypothetical protein